MPYYSLSPIRRVIDATYAKAMLVYTHRGHLGLAPKRAEPGDYVVIVPGGSVPYILRPYTGNVSLIPEYLFVGER